MVSRHRRRCAKLCQKDFSYFGLDFPGHRQIHRLLGSHYPTAAQVNQPANAHSKEDPDKNSKKIEVLTNILKQRVFVSGIQIRCALTFQRMS